MLDNASSITNSVDSFTKDSFGEGSQFLLDATHVLPLGLPVKWAYCLTDVTGFTASSLRIVTGSGAWPSDLVAGVQLPADIYNIAVTTGTIICFIG